MSNITENRKQEVENRKSLEFSSPDNHQYATVNSKEDYVSYLSDDDVAEEHDKDVAALVLKTLKCASKEDMRVPILYELARDILAMPEISTPVESFFSIVNNVIKKPRNNSSPATTKMFALVKNKVTKLRLCDVDMGIESGDTNIDDDLDLCAEFIRYFDDNSDEIIMHNEDEDRDCYYFAD